MIRAVTIGSTASKILDTKGVFGTVCAVFDRAVDIVTDQRELVALARKDMQNSPIVVLLDLPPDVCMYAFGVQTGAHVTKCGSFIKVDNSNMIVRLDEATLWNPRRQVKTHLAVSSIMKNCATARDIGKIYGQPGGLSNLLNHLNALVYGEPVATHEFNLYAKQAVPSIRLLIKTILDRNLEAIHLSVNDLIGLGPGLTPSCDDMLMGFMTSLALVTEALDGDLVYAMEANQAIASFVGEQTTLVSRALLEHSASGEAPELTYNIVQAIATGTDAQVREATSHLLCVGHFSGTDTLIGVLLGVHVVVNMAPY